MELKKKNRDLENELKKCKEDYLKLQTESTHQFEEKNEKIKILQGEKNQLQSRFTDAIRFNNLFFNSIL